MQWTDVPRTGAAHGRLVGVKAGSVSPSAGYLDPVAKPRAACRRGRLRRAVTLRQVCTAFVGLINRRESDP